VEEPAPIETARRDQCLECDRPWIDDSEHWRAYFSEERELLLYCPDCARREFDA
jgi:hypothetical protein